MNGHQKRASISATVILTSKSWSSFRDAMCFLIESRIYGLSHRTAISLSTLTHTSRIFATTSFEAKMMRFIAFIRYVCPWTLKQIYLKA